MYYSIPQVAHIPSLTPIPEIVTVPPKTQYVPYNEKNVTFYCEVTGSALIWEYNSIQIEDILRRLNVFIEVENITGQSGNIRWNSTLLVVVDESNRDKINKSEISCFPPDGTESVAVARLWTYGKYFLVYLTFITAATVPLLICFRFATISLPVVCPT